MATTTACRARARNFAKADGEEGGWALLSPMEEALENEAVLAMVRSGKMLPADGRYFIAARGDERVVRKEVRRHVGRGRGGSRNC